MPSPGRPDIAYARPSSRITCGKRRVTLASPSRLQRSLQHELLRFPKSPCADVEVPETPARGGKAVGMVDALGHTDRLLAVGIALRRNRRCRRGTARASRARRPETPRASRPASGGTARRRRRLPVARRRSACGPPHGGSRRRRSRQDRGTDAPRVGPPGRRPSRRGPASARSMRSPGRIPRLTPVLAHVDRDPRHPSRVFELARQLVGLAELERRIGSNSPTAYSAARRSSRRSTARRSASKSLGRRSSASSACVNHSAASRVADLPTALSPAWRR